MSRRSIRPFVASRGPIAALALAVIVAPAMHDAPIARRDPSGSIAQGSARACIADTASMDSVKLRSAGTPDPAFPLARRGNVFVSHGHGSTVSIVNLATGEIHRVQTGLSEAHEVTVSPDGRYGVAAEFGDHTGDYEFSGRRLAVVDLRARKVARIIDTGPHLGPHDLVFRPGSSTRLFVTTQTTRNVIEVDVESGQVLGETKTMAKGSHTMAITADGRTAFTANQPEGTLSKLDLDARRLVRKFGVGQGQTEGVAVTPDGREVWIGLRDEGVVRVVSGETGEELATLRPFGIPDRMTVSPDGRFVLITDFRCGTVLVADAKARRVIGPITGLGDAGVAKFLPDSRTAVIAMLRQRDVVMVDVAGRRVLARHALGRAIDAAWWGPGDP